MAKLHKIKELVEKNRYTIVDLAKATGLSKQAIHNAVKNNNTTVASLEKIAAFLQVPVGYFFDEVGDGPVNGIQQLAHGNNNKMSIDLNNCHHQVELLKKEIEGLKNELKLKDDIIEILKNK